MGLCCANLHAAVKYLPGLGNDAEGRTIPLALPTTTGTLASLCANFEDYPGYTFEKFGGLIWR